MKFAFVGFGVLSAICLSAVCNNGVYAQVTADNTLQTSVTPTTSPNGGNIYNITDGTRVGNNLFHSFSQFSLPTGSATSFQNATDIQNIFSRVTGGNISQIDGAINALGNANNLTIDTARLKLIDGGAIRTSSFFIGYAGDLRINATESVEVNGYHPISPSNLSSSAQMLPSEFQRLFRLSNYKLTADAGTVNITTPNLILKNQGTVSVTNQGAGNGGSLKINADSIQLKNQAFIEARTASGNGGNINLQVGKVLLLRDRSQITSTAQGNGNGGNITINSPIVFGWENSDIIANAFQGKGGNINITSQGILGLEYRSQLTLKNDITASSQFGVNGTVEVNTIGVDPNSGLIELPVNVNDASQKIATGCADTSGSSFVATGRGGIPQNPTQELRSDRPWSDVRDISAFHTTKPAPDQISTIPQVLVQATSWHRNAFGKIELVADQSTTHLQPSLTCAAVNPN